MYRKDSEGWLKHADFIVLDMICLQLAYVLAYAVSGYGFNPYMILNKYMQNKKDISAVGGYGNLDILKILLALLIVLRHIGQWFLSNNVFWHVYIINTISTIGVTQCLNSILNQSYKNFELILVDSAIKCSFI